MQAEAEHSKREEILQSGGDQQSEINLARGEQQDCDSVEQSLSVQDPGAHAQPKPKHTRHHRSLRCHEQGIVFQCEDPIGEINKHVSDGINKLPVENKCDLTSQNA